MWIYEISNMEDDENWKWTILCVEDCPYEPLPYSKFLELEEKATSYEELITMIKSIDEFQNAEDYTPRLSDDVEFFETNLN